MKKKKKKQKKAKILLACTGRSCIRRLAAMETPLMAITVADPQKQGEGLSSFVTYKVTTQVRFPPASFLGFG